MRRLSDEEKIKKINETARFGERAISFPDRHTVVLLDPEYGEFSCRYQQFIRQKSRHPDRCNNKPLTQEVASKLLNEKGLNYIKVKHWGGKSTAISTFTDAEYGDFEGIFHEVIRQNRHHPERSKKRKQESSKKLWEDAAYREKTIRCINESLSEESIKKRKQTLMKKTGYDSPLKNPETLKKAQETTRRRYGVYSYAKSEAWQNETVPYIQDVFKTEKKDMIVAKRQESRIKNGNTYIYQNKTIKQWATELNKAYTTLQSQVKKFGFETAIQINRSQTNIELAIEKILKKNNVNYKMQVWSADEKYIYDFVVEDFLVIECNGVFWHSDAIIDDKEYHYKKRQSVLKENKKLLMFLETEIRYKSDIVENVILDHLKDLKEIDKNLFVKEISLDQAKLFLEENHLAGKAEGQNLSLQDENGLLYAVICYKISNIGIDILRFCTLQNKPIEKSFSTLVEQILRNCNPELIQYHLDHRFDNNLAELINCGFRKENEHLDYMWTRNTEVLDKSHFTGDSGYELGWYKIWDCGQSIYIWIKGNIK